MHAENNTDLLLTRETLRILKDNLHVYGNIEQQVLDK